MKFTEQYEEITEGKKITLRPKDLPSDIFNVIHKEVKGVKYPANIKHDDNMLTITFVDNSPAGVTSMGGQDTGLGQELKKYKEITKKTSENIIKKMSKVANIEDSEISDGSLFMVSDDFMK